MSSFSTLPTTALYPPGQVVLDAATRSVSAGVDIGRLAATSFAIPFSVIYAQTTSQRDRRLYAFAAAVIRAVAAEMISELPRDGEAAIPGRRPQKRTVAMIAKYAAARRAAVARERAGKLPLRSAQLRGGLSGLISAVFKAYDAVELRELCQRLGVRGPHGADALSRADALREVSVAAARRLTAEGLDTYATRADTLTD